MNGGASNSKVVRTARDRLIDLHSSAYPKGVTWKKHDSGGPRPITATGRTGKGNAALKGWALSGFCVREPGSEQKSGSEGSTPEEAAAGALMGVALGKRRCRPDEE